MPYEAIPLVIFLMIPMLAGLALIGDAFRRVVQEMRRSGHDLHG